MSEKMQVPRVFISYSQSDHKEMVLDIVDRLRSDGVDAIVDEYDLELGHDVNLFMERTVNDPELAKVLLMCDKSYTEKANARKGGAGKEAIIISEEVYNRTASGKFIPVILERDENGNPYRPVFIKGAIYCDLSDDLVFEANYEKLIRDIYGKPLRRKPKIGHPPEYLLSEDSPTFPELNGIVRQIQEKNLSKERQRKLFFESGSFIVEALEQLSQDDNVPKSLLERVSLTKPIRDKCLLILKESYESAAITANDIGDFIQKVHCDVSPVKGVNSYGSSIVESIDFFFCELFICSVCMLLETEDYIAVHDLLYRTYFLRKHWFSNEMPEPLPYDCFRKYLQAIEQSGRMQPGNEHSFSIVGDLLVSRELKPFWTAQKIRQTDVFLFQMGEFINRNDPTKSFIWYPTTAAHYYYSRSTIWQKLVSKMYCRRMLPLFELSSIEELKVELRRTETMSKKMEWGCGSSAAFGGIPGIVNCVEIDKIGSMY